MRGDLYAPDDDVCPVREELLGELYRASKLGLPVLVATVPPHLRAMLALFCYRRSHLHTLGLAIAASCEEDDLVRFGGRVGATLAARSREELPAPLAPGNANRRKVTLATGLLRTMAPLEDEPDDDLGEPAPAV
ncbi:MAG TPA: hypothetical protein VIY51_13805 [Xanthobacteraceae bacterium]